MRGDLATRFKLAKSTYNFTKQDNELIRRCVAAWKSEYHCQYGLISRDTFPMGYLGQLLRARSWNLHNTTPVILFRGLDLKDYTNEDLIIIHTAISCYIGDRRGVQTGDLEKDKLVTLHIQNFADKTKSEEFLPSSNNTVEMPFHTDGTGDIISLFYLQVSYHGGDVFVSPSWMVYNYLVEHHPEVVDTLRENWEWDIPGHSSGVIRSPLLHFTTNPWTGEDQVHFQFEKRPFFGAQGHPRNPKLRPLSEKQLIALKKVDDLAPTVALKINPQKGDILFVNNRCVFHARNSYRDDFQDITETPADVVRSPVTNFKRHVVRMILRDEEYGWPEPSTMVGAADVFDRAKNLGEQVFQVVPEKWPISPQHG